MAKDEIHTIDKATFKGIFFQLNLPQIFEFDDHFEIRSKYKIQYSKRELAGEIMVCLCIFLEQKEKVILLIKTS